METLTNPRHQLFVDAYCADLLNPNATQAAIKAGYSEKTATAQGSALLTRPDIAAAVAVRKTELVAVAEAATEFGVKELTQMWVDIATGNPLNLAKTVTYCCRHCHGIGHHYQWLANEYIEASAKAERNQEQPPPCDGGFDFTWRKDPHPECPECKGAGIEQVVNTDSRKLSAKDRLLVAGVRNTKYGPEYVIRDQNAALMAIAKILGVMSEGRTITGPGGGPVQHAVVTLNLPDDPQDAARLYQQIMEGNK